MSLIIITAADANYFELVKGTILSIRQKPQASTVAIGFLDLGCTAEQLAWLQQQVDIIQAAKWEFDFPGQQESPDYFKGLLARPFLRQYFPNFEVYCWIDADAWVQDWRAVELFVRGATRRRGLAIAPELDRSSSRLYGLLPEFWRWTYAHYQAAFGEEVAEYLHSFPMLNAGVFALHQTAAHWEVWADCLEQGLQNKLSLVTDQLALNLTVYGFELFEQTEILSAWCNWTCHCCGLPIWNQQAGRFVEPYLPHTEIGILHLSADKHEWVKLPTTDGDLVEVNLRYTPEISASD